MNQFILLLASNSDAEINLSKASESLLKAFPTHIQFSKQHWTAAVHTCPNVNQLPVVSSNSNKTVLHSSGLHTGIMDSREAKYLNRTCKGQTDWPLAEVQNFLKSLESMLGRIRGEKALGQVAIDIDLVEWNGEILRPKDAAQYYYRVCMNDFNADAPLL